MHGIVGELGRGGGGTVYEARQLAAGGRTVAVKVVHGTSKPERERMVREVRALGQLAHPNIVTVHEVGECPDGPYFSMEYMANGSLARRLGSAPLAAHDSARLLEAVARGVAAAHAGGILHRDLKPSNVLLSADGTPKVSDFGLAKFLDGPTDATTLEQVTPTDAFLGTPQYMAPEQAACQSADVDERTDVYGLGAVLYHCLAGRPPFGGKSSVEIAHRVLTIDVTTPRALNRAIPADLEAVCLKCLEKEKDRRYESAAAVGDDLNRFLRGEPTVARPLPWFTRTGRKLRRSRRRIGVAALAGGLIAAAVWVGSVLFNADAPTVPPPDPDAALVRMETDLAAGKPVVLVPSAGPPKWHKVIEGLVLETEARHHDGAWTLATDQDASVLLLRSPPAQGYELSAELRHERGHTRQPNKSWVGLFFRRELYESPFGPVLSVYGVRFTDVFPKGAGTCDVELIRSTELQRPSERPLISQAAFNGAEFAPSPAAGAGAKKWRRITVTVRPDGLAASWEDVPGQPEPIGLKDYPAATVLQNLNRDFDDRLQNRVDPKAGQFRFPEWTTAGAVGLTLYGAELSVRNVIVRPRPNTPKE
jgi:serine/threonine-protein kinase